MTTLVSSTQNSTQNQFYAVLFKMVVTVLSWHMQPGVENVCPVHRIEHLILAVSSSQLELLETHFAHLVAFSVSSSSLSSTSSSSLSS